MDRVNRNAGLARFVGCHQEAADAGAVFLNGTAAVMPTHLEAHARPERLNQRTEANYRSKEADAIDIDLSDTQRQAVVGILNAVLADEFVL